MVDRQRDWFAGDAAGGRLYLDADRSGNWGGIHQSIHRSIGGSLPAGGSARRSARGIEREQNAGSLVADLALIPDLVGRCLDREAEVLEVARALKDTRDALYLGRGINMPIAYEGALKLKEISYIHAEAYPAGEMKHGPIALVDKDMPVIAIAPLDPWYEKMISQIEQVKARGGVVVAVATEGDTRVPGPGRPCFLGTQIHPGCSARW